MICSICFVVYFSDTVLGSIWRNIAWCILLHISFAHKAYPIGLLSLTVAWTRSSVPISFFLQIFSSFMLIFVTWHVLWSRLNESSNNTYLMLCTSLSCLYLLWSVLQLVLVLQLVVAPESWHESSITSSGEFWSRSHSLKRCLRCFLKRGWWQTKKGQGHATGWSQCFVFPSVTWHCCFDAVGSMTRNVPGS